MERCSQSCNNDPKFLPLHEISREVPKKILCLHQRKKENQYKSAKACYGNEWHQSMITLHFVCTEP